MVLIVSPKRESYLGELLSPITDRYTQFLEILVPWSFFAPEPGPPPVYIEWEILGPGEGMVARGQIPEAQSPYWIRERQNKRIVFTRFLMGDEKRIEDVMVPYLCKLYPAANSIRLWKVGHSVPSILDVQEGRRKIGDGEMLERRMTQHSFCEGKR